MNMSLHSPQINPDRGNTVSRRSALGITGGSLAAFMLGAVPVKAATHDPIPGWFAEWQANRAAWTASEPESPEENRLWVDAEVIERRIMSTKPTSRDGLAAQLEFALESGLCGGEMGGVWLGMDKAMFEGMIHTLRGGLV
ncbi:hypothetical protein [Sulfitobacter dubius]|uniref:Tat (Twin-arginine translocation) pathway signal sequence n=1 Tax=Sulfitobacter dubius TaxID=218673 RepID=A0ABY3ZIP6_9RHOB|nr:hypothetical protein [Sulfitobacter dubius]UOA14530.1 hypothetical protein DSM109990_01336 [Sulfitobacter dubius]